MKIIAWNINGIRSSMKENDLYNLIQNEKPDIICFGETKISCPFEEVQEELINKIKGYKYRYWSPSSLATKIEALNKFLGPTWPLMNR